MTQFRCKDLKQTEECHLALMSLMSHQFLPFSSAPIPNVDNACPNLTRAWKKERKKSASSRPLPRISGSCSFMLIDGLYRVYRWTSWSLSSTRSSQFIPSQTHLLHFSSHPNSPQPIQSHPPYPVVAVSTQLIILSVPHHDSMSTLSSTFMLSSSTTHS